MLVLGEMRRSWMEFGFENLAGKRRNCRVLAKVAGKCR
jgi:hypothetical protein